MKTIMSIPKDIAIKELMQKLEISRNENSRFKEFVKTFINLYDETYDEDFRLTFKSIRFKAKQLPK
jgi:hypothetical protein